MGGFQTIDEDGTSYELAGVIRIESSHLHILNIPVEEIEDRSKADFVAKMVTVVQTLWFAMQILHRAIEGLTVTEIELTTLAHVVLNIFVYWCWWNKPVNLRFPFEVYPIVKKSDDRDDEEKSSGQVESQVHPRRLPMRVRLANYLSRHGQLSWLGVAFLFIISSMFGAIHCLAWNAHFPTNIESKLWRASAVIVTAAPPTGFLLGLVVHGAFKKWKNRDSQPWFWGQSVIIAVFYALARICLLALALSTLRTLPYNAYLIPSWTRYIPHI